MNTEDINYGPLAGLIGTWQGDKGEDLAPEPDGTEHNAYRETLVFQPAGDVTNAEQQTLAVLRYHQSVARVSTGKVIHDEVGYWMYDAETGTVSHSLTIPRGVCVLAGGEANVEGELTTLTVSAKAEDPQWSILQSPFMSRKANTRAFDQVFRLQGDTLSYQQTMLLAIYDREFEHTDANTLERVA